MRGLAVWYQPFFQPSFCFSTHLNQITMEVINETKRNQESPVPAPGHLHDTVELLKEIVDTDSKGRYRFSPDGKRIKACQGHSISWVTPELEVRKPPEYLYHGTTTDALQDIMTSGAILRMSRHAVHMQADITKAWQSAERRKNKTPVVLKIAAGKMNQNGAEFSISENGVWFCERVPTEYIEKFLYTKDC